MLSRCCQTYGPRFGGYTFDSFTNIIDVYVNYLRKKIDREGDKKLIHTVRGVGYVFKDEE
jgi:DNA-binding response OmpR family regulator